jgi:hypothetical protein
MNKKWNRKIVKKYECRKKSEIRETTFQKDIRARAREICQLSRKFGTQKLRNI